MKLGLTTALWFLVLVPLTTTASATTYDENVKQIQTMAQEEQTDAFYTIISVKNAFVSDLESATKISSNFLTDCLERKNTNGTKSKTDQLTFSITPHLPSIDERISKLKALQNKAIDFSNNADRICKAYEEDDKSLAGYLNCLRNRTEAKILAMIAISVQDTLIKENDYAISSLKFMQCAQESKKGFQLQAQELLTLSEAESKKAGIYFDFMDAYSNNFLHSGNTLSENIKPPPQDSSDEFSDAIAQIFLAIASAKSGQPSTTWMKGETAYLNGKNCCKICRIGKACGDTCITKDDICHVPVGCACNQ